MNRYIIRLLVYMAVAAPIYIFIRKPFRRGGKREIALAVFWAYQVGLLALVFKGNYGTVPEMIAAAAQRVSTMQDINLVPFKTLKHYFSAPMTENVLMNILGNVLLFIPWGFGLPLFWKESRKPLVLLPELILPPVLIECCQLYIDRFVDVDDVLLNAAGNCIGVLLFLLLRKYLPKLDDAAR